MTDTTSDTNEPTDTVEPSKPKKEKAAPKRLTVRVLRAVDSYHHRNAVINVPNDEYHRGLLAQGNLRVVS